jgi:hypothetical protein
MRTRIDMQNALAEMARLAVEAGDWRNHPPFDSILNWHTDETVRRESTDHVQGCRFCLEGIEMFRPVDSENEPQ